MPFLTPEKYMRGKAKSGVENETRWNESQLGQVAISTPSSLNIISSLVFLVAILNYLGKRLDRD